MKRKQSGDSQPKGLEGGHELEGEGLEFSLRSRRQSQQRWTETSPLRRERPGERNTQVSPVDDYLCGELESVPEAPLRQGAAPFTSEARRSQTTKRANAKIGKTTTKRVFKHSYSQLRHQKYKQPELDKSLIRYTLIYSDDTLQNVLNVKRQLMYCRPQNDGGNAYYEVDSNKMDNEFFKQKLRSEKGIFFNFNVSPSSPRKAKSPQASQKQVLMLRESEPARRYCDQNGPEKSSVEVLLNSQDSNCRFTDGMSFTKQARQRSREPRHANIENSDSISFEIESDRVADSDDDEPLRTKRGRQTSAEHSQNGRQQRSPLAPNCNEIKLFGDQHHRQGEHDPRRQSVPYAGARSYTKYRRIDAARSTGKQPQDAELGSSMSSVEKKKQMLYLQQEDNLQSSPKADEQLVFEEAMDVDEYQRLRDLEDYLFENYQSPTMREIKHALRRRELAEIDARCQSLQTLIKSKQKKKMQQQAVNLPEVDERALTFQSQPRLSPKKNTIHSLQKYRFRPPPDAQPEPRNRSQILEEHKSESDIHEQRQIKDKQPEKNGMEQILRTEASLEYNGYEAADGLGRPRERSATIKLQQRPHLNVKKNPTNPTLSRAKQNQRLKEYAVEDYQADVDKKAGEFARNDENPRCAIGEEAPHPLFGMVSLIEPNSATFPKFSGQNGRLENQDQAHIRGPTFHSRRNRQLSNLSGQSQTGSDESQFIEVKGPKSDDDEDGGSEQNCDSNMNTRSRFDAFKDIQDQKKSIFTRKFQTKKLLMLQNKIEYDHHEMQQIGGITRRDIEILTKSHNLRDADKGSISPSQAFEKSIFIKRAQRGQLQEEISIQLIENQTSSYKRRRPSQLNSHQRNKEQSNQPFDFNFGKLGSNVVVVRSANRGEPLSGAATSKTTMPLQRRPLKTAKHSNSNLPVSRAGNSNLDLSDDRDNTPSCIPTAKRARYSGSKALELHRSKSNKMSSNINKKERKRQIKRLFNSSQANEDEDFIENQKKKLEWLKELSEKIRGVRVDPNGQDGNKNLKKSMVVGDGLRANRTPVIINYKIFDLQSKGNKTPLVRKENLKDFNEVIKHIHAQVMKRNSDPEKTGSQKSIDRRASNSFSLKVQINRDSRNSGQGIEQLSIHNVFSDKKPSQALEKKNCPSVQEIEIYIDNSEHEDQMSDERKEMKRGDNRPNQFKLLKEGKQSRSQRRVEVMNQASPKFFESNEVLKSPDAQQEMSKVTLNFGVLCRDKFKTINDASKVPEARPAHLDKTSSSQQFKSYNNYHHNQDEEDPVVINDLADGHHVFLGEGRSQDPSSSSFEKSQSRTQNLQLIQEHQQRLPSRDNSANKAQMNNLNKEYLRQSLQTLQIKQNQSVPMGSSGYQRKVNLSKSFMKNLQQINKELNKKTKQQKDQSFERSVDSQQNQDAEQQVCQLQDPPLESQQTTPQKMADPPDKSIPNSCHKVKRQTDWNWDDTFEGNYKHEVNSQNHSSNPFRLKIHNAKLSPLEDVIQLVQLPKPVKVAKKRSRSIQHVQISNSASSKQSESIHRRNLLLPQHLTHVTETRSPKKHFKADSRIARTSASRPETSPARLVLSQFFDNQSNFAAFNTLGKMSNNQSPLAQRMSLLGSVGPNNGSQNPSPDGLKNVSLIDGPFQAGTTHPPPPRGLNQQQKRSQNESAEKIKRLQKLMDEGEIFCNFKGNELPRMVSGTSDSFQHSANAKQSKAPEGTNANRPSKRHGAAPANPIFSQRTEQSLQQDKKPKLLQFSKPEMASTELKLEKCVTDNIRQNISNDLDGLQNIFRKKMLPSPSADRRDKASSKPIEKRPSPRRKPKLSLMRMHTAKNPGAESGDRLLHRQ